MSSLSGQGSIIPKGYKQGRLQKFTPEAMNLYQGMFSDVGPESYLSKLAGGDQDIFDQIEKPALRDFSGLQANTASKYSGMGMGARKSSGFQNEMYNQSSDFAQRLQSNRQSLMQNAIKELYGMKNDLLRQEPYENYLIEKQNKPSFGKQILGGAARAVGTGAGAYFGGSTGANIGYQAGNAFAQGFGV